MSERDDQKHNSTWKFWGTVISAVLVLTITVVTHYLVISWFIASNYGDLPAAEFEKVFIDLAQNGTLLSYTLFSTLVVGSAVMFWSIKTNGGCGVQEYLDLNPIERKVLIQWLVITLGFIVFSDAITKILGLDIVPEFMLSAYLTAKPLWLLWISLIIAAPVFEELFVRGFILKGLTNSFVGPTGAVALSSLFWALLHTQYDLFGMTLIFVVGILFCIAKHKSGSILAPIAMHALMNTVATVQTHFAVKF